MKFKNKYDDDVVATIIACIFALLIPVTCVVTGIVTIGMTFNVIPLIISGEAIDDQIKNYICWGISFFTTLGIIIASFVESDIDGDNK